MPVIAPTQKTRTNFLTPAVSPAYLSRRGQVKNQIHSNRQANEQPPANTLHESDREPIGNPRCDAVGTRSTACSYLRTTIFQIYTLCGGTRLLVGDLADLKIACDYLAGKAEITSAARGSGTPACGALAWPDRRQAVWWMISSLFDTVCQLFGRDGLGASAQPGGSIDTMLARRDAYEVHRRNADPEQVLAALELAHAARAPDHAGRIWDPDLLGDLRELLAEQIHDRSERWFDRVVRPVIPSRELELEHARPDWKGYCDKAVAMSPCYAEAFRALGFPVYGLGPKVRGEALEDAGHAELAALAEHMVADLASPAPRLRVRVDCPDCGAPVLWHPHTGVPSCDEHTREDIEHKARVRRGLGLPTLDMCRRARCFVHDGEGCQLGNRIAQCPARLAALGQDRRSQLGQRDNIRPPVMTKDLIADLDTLDRLEVQIEIARDTKAAYDAKGNERAHRHAAEEQERLLAVLRLIKGEVGQ